MLYGLCWNEVYVLLGTHCVTEKLQVALGVQVCSALVLHLFLHCPFCASLKSSPQPGAGKGWSRKWNLGRSSL